MFSWKVGFAFPDRDPHRTWHHGRAAQRWPSYLGRGLIQPAKPAGSRWSTPTEKNKPPDVSIWGFGVNLPDDVLLSRARCSLSSALKRFTVLFGMGRSGSTSLWSSGMTCRQQGCPASQSGKRSYRFQLLDRIAHIARGCDRTTQSSSADFLQSYRVKPHGQLVLVSLTCHHASTPSLSTSWSRTTLQGDLVPREISSLGEFPA